MPTSEEWLKRLNKELDERQSKLEKCEQYYFGVQPLAYASEKFREAFGGRFRAFSDNFCALVIDTTAQRLTPWGFRLGEDTGARGRFSGDQDAWNIWQANYLDADSKIVHRDALMKAYSYVLVQPGGDVPLVTVEDARQCITVSEASNRRRRIAGLKRWVDDSKFVYATLYLPDRIEKYQSENRTRSGMLPASIRWIPRLDEDGQPSKPIPNPIGKVPLVPFINQPAADGTGRSDLANVMPLQDSINKTHADMLVAAEYQSFKQRWATGIEIPTDPETGKPVESFQSAASRLWAVPDEGAQFGEFSQTDLSQFIKAMEMDVQHIASQSHTPAHYLLGSMGTFPSGESLKATETAHVKKVLDRMTFFEESWEEVMRLAFKMMGDPRGDVMDSQVIWADPESRTEAEHVDALLKMGSLGVPNKALWEKWGATPQEIDRWETMGPDVKPEPPVS